MALELKISVTTSSGNFVFSETTGAYDPATNPTGWGAPNPATGFATAVDLFVYPPDPATMLPSNTATLFQYPAGFPTTSSSTTYIITPQMLSTNAWTILPDGVYQFLYSIDVTEPSGDVNYEVTQYVLVYAGVQCCAGKLAVKAASSGCGCSGGCGGCGDDASNFEKVMLMIEAAKYSIQCGSITSAAKAIVHAQEICNGCQSCC